jgi:hypothetical protein
VIGALAAYPVAAISTGFADSALERVDHFLRFDWLAWYRFVVEHPAISGLSERLIKAYFLPPQCCSLTTPGALAGLRRASSSYLSGWLRFLRCCCSSTFPRRGRSLSSGMDRCPMCQSALYQADLIPALRSHAAKPIDLGALRGLVAAPSFHAASALLYIAAAWPLRPLRWPVTILNAAMLLATPVEGTHYLVDLIAGAAVALAALAITQLAARRFSPRLASRPQRWKTAQSTISSAE